MKWRKWILIYLGVSISFGRISLAQQLTELPASSDHAADRHSAVNDVEVKLTDAGRAAVDKVIEEIIESSKQSGEREKLVAWETRRGKPVTVGEVRDLANWCDYLRGTGQMLSAQRMSVQLQVIAEPLKADNPGLVALIQLKLSYLDDDFERYEVALRRFDSVTEILKSQKDLSEKSEIPNRKVQAYYLRKLGKYSEAEQKYLQYLRDAGAHPERDYKDEMLSARFELAAMYANMGAFQQWYNVMPKELVDYYGTDGNVVPTRVALELSAYVKYYMSDEKKDLEAAEKHCQGLIDQMQHYDGVSSRSYVEAVELMAKVRAAQKRYGDAEELLKKSAQIRAELFGADHPSVARVHKEIDRVRKLAR